MRESLSRRRLFLRISTHARALSTLLAIYLSIYIFYLRGGSNCGDSEILQLSHKASVFKKLRTSVYQTLFMIRN